MNDIKEVSGIYLTLLRNLYENAKVTYKELGKRCNTTSVTCYNKVQELLKKGIIRRFTVDIDHKRLGYELEVILELKVKRGLPRSVAIKLHKLPHVEYVWEITGATDLFVRAYFKDVNELNDFLHTLGNQYPEIENVMTHVVLGSYRNPKAWF